MLLDFYTDFSKPNYYGYVVTSVFVVLLLIRTLMINHGNDLINEGVTTSYACLYTALYRRLLHLVESTKGVIGTGRIVNFFTTDSTFVADMLNMINNVWVAPLHLIISVTLIYLQVEWAAFICVGMIVIMIFVQSLVMGAFIRNRFANQRETDKRTKLLQEFFEGIRIIKYYAWERFAHKRVLEVRDREINEMTTALYLRALYEFIAMILPIFAMLITFAIYATYIGTLTVTKVFTVISLFRILQMPLWLFVSSVIMLAQSKASRLRMEKFFELTRASANSKTLKDESLPIGKIVIENGTFSWENAEIKEACEQFGKLLEDRFGPARKPGAPGQKAIEPPNSKEAETKKEEKKEEEITKTSSKSFAIIKDINITVEPKQIVAIVGVVGSGKSSLANAMIGEMLTMSGKTHYNGKIAYIAQNAWIMNGTLKDNILMNQPYDEIKYQKVLSLCELNEDLDTFPKRDLVEIGSKGINLSGGQKQRVAIARAVYADADIYIIDDCLSALDPHVGKCIFQNVIISHLSDKTRVFVTHGMSYLINFSDIVVMKNGRIVARGSYDDLKENSEEFKHLTILDKEKHSKKEEKAEEKKEEQKEIVENAENSPAAKIEDKKVQEKPDEDKKDKKQLIEKGKLIDEEKQETGGVSFGNYLLLIKFSGIFIAITCFMVFAMEQAGSIIVDWWVGAWAADKYGKSDNYYIGVYAGISAAQGIIVMVRGFLYAVFIMNLAKQTQDSLVWAILRAPLQWFVRTPVGRIMNRCCKDQAHTDNDLVWILQATVRMMLGLIGSVVLVGIVTYYFFIILAVILILYVYYYRFSIQAARDSRRMEAVAKSPIFVQYEESLDGLSTIRAYKYEDMFNKRMIKKVNCCMNAYFMVTRCVRWLNLRVDFLSTIVVAGAFYLAVYQRNVSNGDQSNMIGLSLSQSLNVVYTISTFLMVIGMLDTQMSSFERIFEYINETPKERDFEEPKPKDEEWPKNGEVELKNMNIKYRKDLPFVLKNLNVKIAPREKVGIAGRTGSGKSTLTLGLLRVIEPIDPKDAEMKESDRIVDPENPGKARYADIIFDPAKGAILIDGVDVTEIGLHVLRRNIAIIPQDPILFSGTIKTNLDPYTESSLERDREIVKVLHKVKLYEKIWVKLIETPTEKKSEPDKSQPKPIENAEQKPAPEQKIDLNVDLNSGTEKLQFPKMDRKYSSAAPKIEIPDPYFYVFSNI